MKGMDDTHFIFHAPRDPYGVCAQCGGDRHIFYDGGGLICRACRAENDVRKKLNSIKLRRCRCGMAPKIVWWKEVDLGRFVDPIFYQVQCPCGMQSRAIEGRIEEGPREAAKIWNGE